VLLKESSLTLWSIRPIRPGQVLHIPHRCWTDPPPALCRLTQVLPGVGLARRKGGPDTASETRLSKSSSFAQRPPKARAHVGSQSTPLERVKTRYRLVPLVAPSRYLVAMATSLRLSAPATAALRELSVKTGRSQQELIREAVDRFLGRTGEPEVRQRAIESGLVKAPTPFQDVKPSIRLEHGRTTVDLLDRDDDR